MQTQIVILAAGKGTRMEGGAVPKVLIPLRGKPVISYLLEELQGLRGFPKPVIVVGYKHELVEQTLGDEYVYAFQANQLGTAHAVQAAREKISADNVVVLYGDMPFVRADSLEKLIQLHQEKQATLTMFTCTVPGFEGMYESMNHYGRIIRDTEDNIVKITEFKDAAPREQQIAEVNPGIYVFKSSWLWQNIDAITKDNAQGEYYLTDMVELAIRQGLPIYSLAISPEEVFGINTKSHLEEAKRLLVK